jgi:nucleoside-diphosphate-sugar epimerase
MRVIVTGATGTIGLACVQMLVRAGHQVRAFVRSRERFQRLCPEKRVESAEGDILDRGAVAEGLAGADAVLHCVDFPPGRYSLHWEALRHALESLSTGAQFVYPGNSWVYGPGVERAGPDDPKESRARLGVTKADLEKAVTSEGGTVVRLTDTYGPGVRKGLTATVFRRALAGKTVYFPGNLDRQVEYLYVGDAARALIAPLGCPAARGTEYAAPGPTPIAVRDFLSLIFQAAGQSERVRSVPIGVAGALAILRRDSRPLRELSYLHESPILLDGTGIRSQLGWSPEVDYVEGVRRTIKWLRLRPVDDR